MADIIQASRLRSHSASLIPDRQRSEEKPRAVSGGSVPIQPPPGIADIDRLCDAADRADRAAAARVRMEALMSDKTPHRAKFEYDPYDRARLGFSDDDD